MGLGTDEVRTVSFNGEGVFYDAEFGPVFGCTDPAACNYNELASDDDGSCLQFDLCGVCDGPGLAEGTCDCEGNVLDAVGVCGGGCMEDVDGDGVCDSEDGCVDVDACNYLEPNTTECDFCSCAEGVAEGVGLVLETVATDVEGGQTCYHLFLQADSPDDMLTAVFGKAGAPLVVTTTGTWFQNEGKSLRFSFDLWRRRTGFVVARKSRHVGGFRRRCEACCSTTRWEAAGPSMASKVSLRTTTAEFGWDS